VPHLFLEPEYHGQVSGLSLYIIGVSLGLFTMAYEITCYILDGYRFFFITMLRRPFRMFVLNNIWLPLLFWVVYSILFLRFQQDGHRFSVGEMAFMLLCLWLGGFSVIGFGFAYFTFTDRSVLAEVGERLNMAVGGLKRITILRRERQQIEQTTRVDSFLIWPWESRRVPFLGQRISTRSVQKVLSRNHTNAFFMIVFFLLLLVLLGVFQDQPAFQLPAGATVLLLCSVFIMLIGAVTFWFRRIGAFILIGLAVVLIWFNREGAGAGRNLVFGMNYTVPPASYDIRTIEALASDSVVQPDVEHGTRLLNNWLARYRALHGPTAKPRMLIITTTGGGLRSATWAVNCLQKIDSTLAGRLHETWRFTSGASGGMMGASYYRELMLTDKALLQQRRNDPDNIAAIGRDLLNRVSFSLIANLFVPHTTYLRLDDAEARDRGWGFEAQLMENTQAFAGRRLRDYAQPELQGHIPMFVYSPTIINDGRQLLISPQPISYLAQPARFNSVYANEVPAVEFRRMFAKQGADNLRITSAIRMSASFPYILPFPELPSDPMIQVMDAGVYENFGVYLAIKYIYTFRDWIEKNTRGVVLLQLRDSPRRQTDFNLGEQTFFDRLAGALGSTYHSFAESKDFQNDDVTMYARQWLGVTLHELDLQYIPERPEKEASLNFHLTMREKRDIAESIRRPENRATLQLLSELMAP